MQLRFYQAAGDVHYRRGDLGEAEAAWRLAVDHNERRLGSLSGFEQRDAALRVADKAYRGLAATQWARTGEAADALAAWEWFRNGERPRLRRQPGLPLERLRNETLLAFAELPDAVAAWAFDDRGVTGVRLSATSGEIRRTAERFARLCADRGSELAEVRRLGRQLYEWLVAPLESRLEPDRTLVVMPDGPVAAIPFAALVDTRSRYLGERFDIVTAGSAEDYLRRAGRPAVGAGSRALIVVDPVLGADAARAFPPLPHARREGELVAARFQHSMVLAGERATLAAIEQRRPHAGVLHFAGHGFAHAGNGGLLLASGDSSTIGWEVLDGKRLGGQDWTHCRLAVLSACSAGTGEARGPVNPESLVRRLLWAGIARVVASRWRIDSRTALELMEEFYSGLLSGLDTPAALRRSGGRIRDREATRHPYYWAGFQTFGSR
jgi:CHAT domain-containing protein